MPELRSMPNTNRWHIVEEGGTPCRMPFSIATSDRVVTITDEEFVAIANTNQVNSIFFDKPGQLCRRCISNRYPHLYGACVNAVLPSTCLPKTSILNNNRQVKLLLNRDIVEQAKVAVATTTNQHPQTVTFSAVAIHALDRYGKQLRNNLRQAGLVKTDVEGRPRLVTPEFWDEIGKISDDYDISKTQAVRALLCMLVNDQPPE
jgi:hypothetical protein